MSRSGRSLERAGNRADTMTPHHVIVWAAVRRLFLFRFLLLESQKLIVEEYKARMALPNERWIFIDGRPSPASTEQYELDLARSRSLVWT